MKNRRYRCTRPARRTIKAVVTLLGAILLFRWWSAIAYTTRGYKAIGGEYFALTLPLYWAATKCVMRDFTDGTYKQGQKESTG